jgi:hypothetical protein
MNVHDMAGDDPTTTRETWYSLDIQGFYITM